MINIAPCHDFTYDGAVVKVFYANIGEGLSKHSHQYAHATLCTSGSCMVRKEHKQLVMTKETQPVNLIAGEWHEIEALENNTVFINIFSETKQG